MKLIEKIKYLHRAYRYRNRVDAAEIAFLLQHIQSGNTVLDVGCHKGAYLYWMRKKAGEKGSIIGFEPQPKLFAYLQMMKRIFKQTNVQLINKALSHQAGRVSFFIPHTKSGTSPGAGIDKTDQDTTEIDIETLCLDDFVTQNQLTPHFIKIDVEGHELQVLKGALETLKKHHPVLLIEAENRHLKNASVLDLFTFLEQLNYQAYFFQARKLTDISLFDAQIHQKNTGERFWAAKDYCNNFAFVPKS